jgi:hypothetical protein
MSGCPLDGGNRPAKGSVTAPSLTLGAKPPVDGRWRPHTATHAQQPRTAAAALSPVWALGDFYLEPIPELPFDARDITLG